MLSAAQPAASVARPAPAAVSARSRALTLAACDASAFSAAAQPAAAKSAAAAATAADPAAALAATANAAAANVAPARRVHRRERSLPDQQQRGWRLLHLDLQQRQPSRLHTMERRGRRKRRCG